MKRGWRVFWIIIASIAGLGIVFSCIALGLGLTFGQIREAYPNGIGWVSDEHGKIHSVNDYDNGDIVDGENGGWYQEENGEWYYDDDLKDDHDAKALSPDAKEFEGITRLEMSVGQCEVKILPSSDGKVRVDSSGIKFHDLSSHLEVKQEDETLSVKMKKNGELMKIFSEMTGNDSLKYGTLYLYLPEDLELKEADLRFGAVDVVADILKAKNLTLQIGAADCVTENLNVENIDILVGAGDLELTGKVRGDAKVKCGVGEVNMELEGTSKDFDYKIKCGIGEVSIDENLELSGLAGTKKIDNNSSRKMEIDCGVGNVDVSFY